MKCHITMNGRCLCEICHSLETQAEAIAKGVHLHCGHAEVETAIPCALFLQRKFPRDIINVVFDLCPEYVRYINSHRYDE